MKKEKLLNILLSHFPDCEDKIREAWSMNIPATVIRDSLIGERELERDIKI